MTDDPREDNSVDVEELSDGELIDKGICPNCYDDIIHTGGCRECRSKCGFALC